MSVALAGCLESGVQRCADDVVCKPGLVCDNTYGGCVNPQPCRGLGEGDQCRGLGVLNGVCASGACINPTCSELPPMCGPTGTSSCCTSPFVQGGTFYRSYDVATDGLHTSMAYPATVSDFQLDTYEVTVGRFRQFVYAGFGTQENPPFAGAGARTLNGMASQGGWDSSWNGKLATDRAHFVATINQNCDPRYRSWTDVTGANEALPMNCITWYDAFAFCVWDGGFLPTEAEWNYASAGGSEQRAYPWSSPASSLTVDCSYANYYNFTTYCMVNPLDSRDGAVSRVGSRSPKGDGKYGQSDLGGNVYEWTLDWYHDPYANPCTDCADLTVATERVIRSGDFVWPESSLRGADRYHRGPDDRISELGFVGVRCARTP